MEQLIDTPAEPSSHSVIPTLRTAVPANFSIVRRDRQVLIARAALLDTGLMTHNGRDVHAVLSGAQDWALAERHAHVTLEHLFFAVTENELGASALIGAGVNVNQTLNSELMKLMHLSSSPPLGENEVPVVDQAVHLLLSRSHVHARRNGRDTNNLNDLVEGAWEMACEPMASPAIAELRKVWSRATRKDAAQEALQAVCDASERICTRVDDQSAVIRDLQSHVSALCGRVVQLDAELAGILRPPMIEAPAKRSRRFDLSELIRKLGRGRPARAS